MLADVEVDGDTATIDVSYRAASGVVLRTLDAERTDRALNLLSAIAAVDTMPKGDDRIARLHARLRARLSDVAVVSL